MTGIREMFAELDGYVRYEQQLLAFGPVACAAQRARWRENKRRQRRAEKAAGKKRDQSHYAKRYANDPAFRERRKKYWRERLQARKAAGLPARRAA